MMRKNRKLAWGTLVIIAVIAVSWWYFRAHTVSVLEPRGPIARQERDLLFIVLLLSLLVVIPVFTSTIMIVKKYREHGSQPHRRYAPTLDHSRKLEAIWWVFPGLIILALSIITWQSTQRLAPYKPIAAKVATMPIEVVALNWKWLFIYPTLHIATVNTVAIPTGTPVDFQTTADAPMNSFWVPQLGGQIYSMAGMETQLNLMASQPGTYSGGSANISGAGFSDMTFKVHALKDQATFNQWVLGVQGSATPTLDWNHYEQLAAPSRSVATEQYHAVSNGLFERIIMQYMAMPSPNGSATSTAPMIPARGNQPTSTMPAMQSTGMSM